MKITKRTLRIFQWSPILLLLLCLSGCSTFKRDWRKAQTAPQSQDDITGPWDGSWVSQRNGHKGRLRALVDKRGGNEYYARFHATFWKIFSYSYALPMTTHQSGHRFTFEGHAHLGWLAGGEYKCHGTATGTNFHAVYSSKSDHGTFQMTRP